MAINFMDLKPTNSICSPPAVSDFMFLYINSRTSNTSQGPLLASVSRFNSDSIIGCFRRLHFFLEWKWGDSNLNSKNGPFSCPFSNLGRFFQHLFAIHRFNIIVIYFYCNL